MSIFGITRTRFLYILASLSGYTGGVSNILDDNRTPICEDEDEHY